MQSFILLDVGFGTGWEGKTGAFLIDNKFMWGRSIHDYLKDCKPDYKKKKHIFTRVSTDHRYLSYPFPKSRKFVFSQKPLLPPGWIELTEQEMKS